jgi:NADH-quinone oxidoreductase subunit F
MERPLTRDIRPGREPLDLKAYEQAGGYHSIRKAFRQHTPKDIIDMVKASGLKGRGGAGFPTGQKWSFMPPAETSLRPRYLCCNADEMEPGTFKDRLLMEGAPHLVVEGVIASAYAIQADTAYIFIRWAYKTAAERLRRALEEARRAGYLGRNILGTGYGLDIHVHPSAGRYMCGEETGLLNSLEGKRANPRSKPPYPAVSGLFGKPTTVNNVETLCSIPVIINEGPEAFTRLSLTGEGGTKLYGISGRVRRPGAWELPLGTPVRRILEEQAGGMRDGYALRAWLAGGASTAFQLPSDLDVPLDFANQARAGSGLGTGAIIVLDDRTCPVGFLLALQRFFARESCGFCTPCWAGLAWIEKTLAAIEGGRGRPEDIEILEFHARNILMGRTYCALAPSAMLSLRSALAHFREDFDRHIREKRCPWRAG